MPPIAVRPDADADTEPCPFSNDPLMKDPIDEDWMDKMSERICREFARQFLQQERMPATTNHIVRLSNVRALDQLYRTLERISRNHDARASRRASKNMASVDDVYAALERRLFDQLEHKHPANVSEESGAQ